MSQIIQVSNSAKRGSYLSSFMLHLNLLGASVLVIGFAILSIVMLALAQYTVPPSNPFSSFEDFFPGQPGNTLETRKFSCSTVPYGNNPDEYCRFYPTTGAFSQVTVLVSKGVIRTTGFRLRDSALSVGDLMLLWGRPLTPDHNSSVHFLSNNEVVTAVITEHTGLLSPFLKVLNVIITNSST